MKTQEGYGTIHESTIKMTTYCARAIKPILDYEPFWNTIHTSGQNFQENIIENEEMVFK